MTQQPSYIEKDILIKTQEYIKRTFLQEGTGHGSTDEYNYFRGIATTINFCKPLSTSVFILIGLWMVK